MKPETPIQSISFSGHESFPLRFAWPTKAVRYCTTDPTIFNRADAVVRLGVGKNMVRSIRHWVSRAGLVETAGVDRRGGSYEPTPLGTLVFGENGVDPYLEDPGTSWLLHWQLCSNPALSPTTWFYLFNEHHEPSFSVEELVNALWKLGEEAGCKKLSRNTIERDVKCLIRTYTPTDADRKLSQEDTYDSPLADLGLVHKGPRSEGSKSDRYFLDRSHRASLPLGIVAFAVASFWPANADTLSFEQIAYAAGSPGQVFKLSENALVEYLESIDEATAGSCRFDSTSGLRQLIRRESPNPLSILDAHYSTGKESDCAA